MKFARRMQVIDELTRGSLTSIGGTSTTGIVSPWSDGQLEAFVWTDIFGLDAVPVTRKEAMTVPAIAAARARIVQLADRPLRAVRADGTDVTTQQTWLQRTDTTETPWQRTARTLDDWIFYGWSLWLVARGAIPADQALGPVQDARHVPYSRWGLDRNGRITVDKTELPDGSYVLLEGPFDGLLNVASETIRAAKALERAWSSRVRNPNPTVIIEELEDGAFSKKEANDYVKQVSKALQHPDGAVLFMPAKAKLRLEGSEAPNVLTEARNAVRIDIANLLNLNASALDGAKPQSSLTYETQETERVELAERMPYWTAPLEHRLSMDDIVPRGTRIRFDFGADTPSTGTPTED